MVTITSSYTIIPSKPTPNSTLWLSGCDQISPWSHSPTIYVYKPNHTITSIILERMRNSLSKLLVHYYPLAGRLRWIEGGRLEVECNAKGVQVLEAESTKEMAEYGDFKPTDAVRDLVPKVDYHSNSIVDLPLLMVQLTRFSCGGLCVGVAISHSLADGLAAVQFINSWAKLAREDRLEEKDLPFLDRTVLKSSEPPMAPRFEHTELKDIRTLNGPHTMSERMKETSVTLLRLTKEQVEKLKKKANEDGLSSSQSRPYSRFEVIAGHIWRCASTARLGDHATPNEQKRQQPTVIRFTANVRNRLNPPLPANYFGNAVLRTRTSPRIIGDIVSNPLSYSAQSIREGIEMLTQENLRSQLDFIAGQEDVSWLRGSFHTLGCMEAPFTGNPDMLIGVWTNIPMYEADFGWGGPLYIGPALLNADGKSFIMSCPSEDGALTIALRFQTIHMESFKKFFYDDI